MSANLFQPANDFSADIFTNLNAVNENLIFSPISVLSTLCLLLWGAKENTKSEIATAIKIPQKPDIEQTINNLILDMNSFKKNITQNEPTLKINDRAFVKSDSEVKISTSFPGKTSLQHIDFSKPNEAAKTINDWVSRSTQGLIKEITSPDSLSSDTLMQVLNTVYFKGSWEKKFQKDKTFEGEFLNSDGSKVKVDMMTSSEKILHAYIHESNFKAQVIELPYHNSNLAMLVVLTDTELEFWIHSLDQVQSHVLKASTEPVKVDLAWPKFKIENTLDLKSPLTQMGMKEAFLSANFSGMLITGQPIKISDAKHVAVIEVDEEGTEAAAATKFEIVSYSLEETIQFICNRPFMFYIIDRDSRIPLFMGAIKKFHNKENTSQPTTV